jgi:DNA-directed RNA polymerase subunit RPC12/RpoP
LVSVEALAKGFDVEDIGCVIDARPLRKSLSTAIQMWGRGLRSSPDTGKTDCLLLDHSGNIQRFLKDFTEIYFSGFVSLDMSEKLDKIVRKDEEHASSGCPQCGYKPFFRRCMSCGHEKQSLALVGEAAGEMREIRIGKKVIATDKQDLWNQLCTYAKLSLKSEDAKKAGWCWYKYQDITGEKPPRAWDFYTAPEAPITRGTLGKLKSLRIAYHKAKEARPAA